MAAISIRDGNGQVKYAALAKGVGTETDPYYLQVSAPINYAAGGQISVAITTDTLVLAANPNRRGAMLQNRGPDAIDFWINGTGFYGTGFNLAVGDRYEINSTNLHTGAIWATAATGTATLAVIEGT
jgi:hypothetical protein